MSDIPYTVEMLITWRVKSVDGKYEAEGLTEEEAADKLEQLMKYEGAL